MIEVNATLFTLLVEGFALACGLLLVATIINTRRKGRDRKALRALVADINNEAAERLERTKSLLGDSDGASALSRHERGVCRAFIGAYDKRAADSVTGIYAALKDLVDAYQRALQQIQERHREAQTEAGKPTPKDAVISKLKNDYEQAARELQVTKSTMDKMLREYSSMFAGGSGEAADSELEASEILQILDASEAEGGASDPVAGAGGAESAGDSLGHAQAGDAAEKPEEDAAAEPVAEVACHADAVLEFIDESMGSDSIDSVDGGFSREPESIESDPIDAAMQHRLGI